MTSRCAMPFCRETATVELGMLSYCEKHATGLVKKFRPVDPDQPIRTVNAATVKRHAEWLAENQRQHLEAPHKDTPVLAATVQAQHAWAAEHYPEGIDR